MRYTNSSPSTPLSAGPRFQDSLATERPYARASFTPDAGEEHRHEVRSGADAVGPPPRETRENTGPPVPAHVIAAVAPREGYEAREGESCDCSPTAQPTSGRRCRSASK